MMSRMTLDESFLNERAVQMLWTLKILITDAWILLLLVDVGDMLYTD